MKNSCFLALLLIALGVQGYYYRAYNPLSQRPVKLIRSLQDGSLVSFDSGTADANTELDQTAVGGDQSLDNNQIVEDSSFDTLSNQGDQENSFVSIDSNNTEFGQFQDQVLDNQYVEGNEQYVDSNGQLIDDQAPVVQYESTDELPVYEQGAVDNNQSFVGGYEVVNQDGQQNLASVYVQTPVYGAQVGYSTPQPTFEPSPYYQDQAPIQYAQPVQTFQLPVKPIIIVNTSTPAYAPTNQIDTSSVNTQAVFALEPVTAKEIDAVYKLLDGIQAVYESITTSMPSASKDKKTIAQQAADILQFYDKVIAYVNEVSGQKDKLKSELEFLDSKMQSFKTTEADALQFYDLTKDYASLRDKTKIYLASDPNFPLVFNQISDAAFKYAETVRKLEDASQQLNRLNEFFMIEIDALGKSASPQSQLNGLEKYDQVLMSIVRLTEYKMEIDGSVRAMKDDLVSIKDYGVQMEGAIVRGEKLVQGHIDESRPDKAVLSSANGVCTAYVAGVLVLIARMV